MDDPTMLTDLPEIISFGGYLGKLIMRGNRELFCSDKDKLLLGITEQLDIVIQESRKIFEESSPDKYGVDLRQSSIFKYRDNILLFNEWILTGFPENGEYWHRLQKKQGLSGQDITSEMFADLLKILRRVAEDNHFFHQNACLQKIIRRFDMLPQEIVKKVEELWLRLQLDTAAQPQLRSQVWRPSPHTMVKPDEHAAEFAEDSTLPEHSSLETNRDSLLEIVHRKLNNSAQQNNLLILWGIGGIGKSELVKLYAQKYTSDYTAADGTKNICFVHCGTSLFATIAALPFTDFNEEEYNKLGLHALYNAKLSLLRESATKGEKLLLVLDNLEMSNDAPLSDKEVFSNLCGLPQNLHIIITRRRKLDYLCCQEVKALEEKDALALFYSYYTYGAAPARRDANEGTIKTILQEIRSNTLMIMRCASLLQERCNSHTPEALRNALRLTDVAQYDEPNTRSTDVFGDSEDSLQLLGHLRKIFAIADLDDNAKEILRNLSLLPPEGLPKKELLKICGWDKEKQYSFAVNSLINTSWLQYEESEDLISMHPVISLLCYEELQPDADNCEQLVKGLCDYIGFDNYQQKDMAFTFEERERLVRIGTFFAGRIHGENINLGRFYNTLGYDLNDMGNYKEALDYYQKGLAIYEIVLGTRHTETATCYSNIGSIYKDLGSYETALEYHRKALAIKEEKLGTRHQDTATSYNNIGIVYDLMGNNEAALEYHRKALSIREEVLGTRHPDTATSYNNIGLVYKKMGVCEAALEYYQKDLTICEEVLGTSHSSTATSYNNIAGVYNIMGNNEAALEYYRKALAIFEEVLGTRHPNTATSYNNIGFVYKAMGENKAALEYFRKDLAICEKVLGTRHLSTAMSYNNIGGVYYSMGNYKAALEYFRKALAIREEVLDTRHPDTAMSYHNVACSCYAMKEYQHALDYELRAAEVFETTLDEYRPTVKIIHGCLAKIYQALGQPEEATVYEAKYKAVQKKS